MSDTPGQMAPEETPLYSFMPNGSAMYMVTVFKDCIEMRVDGRVIRKPIAGWCEAVNSFSETANEAKRWRTLMRAGVTFHESDGEPPVLAAVSKRIWYHATDDQEHNTLAEAMDAYAALFPEAPK